MVRMAQDIDFTGENRTHGAEAAEKFPPPAGRGFRVLPATRGCLHGFCDFSRCYGGATGVLPCYQARDKAADGLGFPP